MPMIVNDGTNSYIAGPDGVPIEQINSKEEPTYLHHDQQGSTRLLTSSTGTVVGAYTYAAYGATEAHTGTANTPLGYDGQLTSSGTGLIYLRARVYDPSTAQFMQVDPLISITRAAYTYAGDNPLMFGDASGLSLGGFLEEVGEAVAGWGDALTLGATKLAREELGINNVNTCSTAYQIGGAAGLATAALIPGDDEVQLPEDASQLGHIFRPVAGHFAEDTIENRQLLTETASDPANYVETNAYGNKVYAKQLPDGREIWVEVRNGVIQNGGVNGTARFGP